MLSKRLYKIKVLKKLLINSFQPFFDLTSPVCSYQCCKHIDYLPYGFANKFQNVTANQLVSKGFQIILSSPRRDLSNEIKKINALHIVWSSLGRIMTFLWWFVSACIHKPLLFDLKTRRLVRKSFSRAAIPCEEHFYFMWRSFFKALFMDPVSNQFIFFL